MKARRFIAIALAWWWWKRRTGPGSVAADGSADAGPREGRTRVEGGELIDGTVEELVRAVQGLLKDESDRAASLNTRASGLTGFTGVILAVAAAAGAVGGRNAGAGLDQWVRVLVGVCIALALAALLAAVIVVVAKVLLPTEGFTLHRAEVKRYPTWEFISRPRVMVQGHLMKGYVKALERDRERNAAKAKWLGRAYKLVCAGLVLVAVAATAATLDRYVAGRTTDRIPNRQDEPRTGTGAGSGADREPVHRP
jgi:hypothetical protein